MINRERLAELNQRELATFTARNPKSKAAYEKADHLFGRVPMTWMNKKAGGFPIYFDRAHGNRIWDIDGHEYIDFALGDTGAMAGHSNPVVIDAIERRIKQHGGLTTMLPTEDAQWVAKNLTERFGMTKWSFSLTATDANRWAIRLVRAITGTLRTGMAADMVLIDGDIEAIAPDRIGATPIALTQGLLDVAQQHGVKVQ